MHDVYSSLGCRTHWLADAPADARIQVILDACGLTSRTSLRSDIHRALSTHLLGRATCDAYETGGDARPADAVAAPHRTCRPRCSRRSSRAAARLPRRKAAGRAAARCNRRRCRRGARAREAPPCLLCIDTWLGDGGAWIERNPAGATACCSIAGCAALPPIL